MRKLFIIYNQDTNTHLTNTQATGNLTARNKLEDHTDVF